MKDLIRREDAIKVIEGVIRDVCNSRVEAALAIDHLCNLAISNIKCLPSAESPSYERASDALPTIMDSLKCVCGSNKVCHTTVDIGVDTTVEELYCPECGIIMRAPSGMLDMLKKNWIAVHMNQPPMNTPMSLEDLRNASQLVYIEYRNTPRLYKDKAFAIRPAYGIVEWSDESSDSFSEYNKHWRCWLELPTIAERSAAEWQD